MPELRRGTAASCLRVCHSRTTGPDGTAATVVHVIGEADIDTAPLLRAELLRAIDESPLVHCDLSGTRYFGAAAVHVIGAMARHATARGHRLELCGVRGITRRVVRIAGLDRIMRVSG